MTKFSGTRRRPLRANLTAPVRTTGRRTLTHEALLMRSAAVVIAAEYVAAGGPHGRAVVSGVLQHADEPAELLGYWLSTHGRTVPMPVKRGVADATRRLYSPPRPPGGGPPVGLRERSPAALAEAGFSWERLSGWLPGGMDAAVGIGHPVDGRDGPRPQPAQLRRGRRGRRHTVDTVIATITDPHHVAKARLFPYQVWAAYKHAPSDNWKRALGRTLDLTVANVPQLDRTLVVIDTSSSMTASVSGRSTLSRVKVAAVMAMATATRAAGVDVVFRRAQPPAG